MTYKWCQAKDEAQKLAYEELLGLKVKQVLVGPKRHPDWLNKKQFCVPLGHSMDSTFAPASRNPHVRQARRRSVSC